MRTILLAAALSAVAPFAFAAQADELAPDPPCVCAAKKRCWGLVMMGYQKRVAMSEEEVEKALPNRFFPATVTFVPREPTADGHFLTVECGRGRTACSDKRDELERRLIVSDILGALPQNQPEGTLYDPITWRITERGEKTFAELKSCRKGLMRELAAVVLAKDGD